ncbi:hypothetical protein [Actinocrispum wychmicini]|uniref:hypothetical protein n=1 Tax=Actinocrispum wychmicini TaxID=1213861 RepID=UPI00104FDA8F|nr:hypothetical protein [Actinocrispum wychmicini]
MKWWAGAADPEIVGDALLAALAANRSAELERGVSQFGMAGGWALGMGGGRCGEWSVVDWPGGVVGVAGEWTLAKVGVVRVWAWPGA